MSAAPLEGLRVVDFTRVLAGPHCTKALRDLGAHVTKIEPPAGDLGRFGLPYVNGIGLYYVQQNAGKRNLSLDLNFAEAREIVRQLCNSADVIVENFRPGTLARFGFGYDDVKASNPGIIYVSLSGFGQSTSWRNRPAFAPTVQAETGLTAIVRIISVRRCRNRAVTQAAMQTFTPDCRESSPSSQPCNTAIVPAKANTSTSRWPPRCCR